MTHLDTAHSYQHGKNESMLGEVLKAYPRDSFVISTKIAASDTPSFLADLDLSLRRLRMDYVDILYIHGAESRDHALSPDALQGLRAAKASGKARHVGVSTHKNEPEVIQAAIDSGLYEVVLTSINFAQDHHEEMKTAIARAAAEGIGIIGMKTMAGGFRDRERTRTVNCKAALKWVLQNPHVTTTIPGMTTFDQLTENATVNTDIVLTEQEKRDLAMARDEGGLYCQACGTCSAACPNGLPIPEIMRAYMYTYGYSDPVLGRELLTRLQVGSDPCYGCNTCRVACVKGFRVAERVSDIARLMTVPPEFLS
jgi:predicted aldo/keto reductase-like oxidoreductase